MKLTTGVCPKLLTATAAVCVSSHRYRHHHHHRQQQQRTEILSTHEFNNYSAPKFPPKLNIFTLILHFRRKILTLHAHKFTANGGFPLTLNCVFSEDNFFISEKRKVQLKMPRSDLLPNASGSGHFNRM